MSLRIHAYPSTPRAFKALVVANHRGVDYEFAFCDLMAGVQKSETFTALNPNQKMPVLEDGAFVLWESNAIMQYLASKKPGALTPTDERGRADVLRWQFWDATTWDPACTKLIFQRVVKAKFNMGGPDEGEVELGLRMFNAAARILDQQLTGRDFVCDRLSVADFALASPLMLAEAADLPLQPYAALRGWAERMAALPAWRATLAMQQTASAA